MGIGLYSPREAARFARVRTQVFNRWFFGQSGSSEPVLRAQLSDQSDEHRLVTFWDLVQAVGVRTLRHSELGARVPLQHIRRIARVAEKEYELEYPFARQHKLFVFNNRVILLTESGDYIGLDPNIDKDQLYEGKIILPYLEELDFG
ncbi:MAG: hypothetical protein AAGD00_04660, partial [Planctomycetota bacterium]